jgi:hypothetical protein
MNIFAGIFFFLHALVHLLYSGHALRFFELRPGLTWPDGAWVFSRLLGGESTRRLAAVSLALTALGFVAGALGLFLKQDWQQTIGACAAVLSIATYLLFWNGKFHDLPDQGGIGLLISLGILVAIWVV